MHFIHCRSKVKLHWKLLLISVRFSFVHTLLWSCQNLALKNHHKAFFHIFILKTSLDLSFISSHISSVVAYLFWVSGLGSALVSLFKLRYCTTTMEQLMYLHHPYTNKHTLLFKAVDAYTVFCPTTSCKASFWAFSSSVTWAYVYVEYRAYMWKSDSKFNLKICEWLFLWREATYRTKSYLVYLEFILGFTQLNFEHCTIQWNSFPSIDDSFIDGKSFILINGND